MTDTDTTCQMVPADFAPHAATFYRVADSSTDLGVTYLTATDAMANLQLRKRSSVVEYYADGQVHLMATYHPATGVRWHCAACAGNLSTTADTSDGCRACNLTISVDTDGVVRCVTCARKRLLDADNEGTLEVAVWEMLDEGLTPSEILQRFYASAAPGTCHEYAHAWAMRAVRLAIAALKVR